MNNKNTGFCTYRQVVTNFYLAGRADEVAALGDADLVATGLPEGVAEALADGLGSRDGEGKADGATTISGDEVGSGFEVTLSLNQTK